MSGVALLVGILTVGGLGGCAVTRVAASDIKVVFVTPPVRPLPDIPSDARGAGIAQDPDAATGRASGVRFGIVPDPSDHGPLSRIADGRIATLEVTWSDPDAWRSERRDTRRAHRGHRGSWHIWYAWPSVYCVYRDSNATWWFGYWLHVDGLRLEGGRLNPQ